MADPTNSSEPNYTARLISVGNICTQWAYLEYLVANTIWWLLKVDRPTGMILTGGLDMIPRINMAINLARHLKADRRILEALEATRKAVQGGLADRRNIAVHGVFSSRDGSPIVTVEVHRGKGDRKRTPLPDEELSNIGKDISSTIDGLLASMKPLGINYN